MPYVAKACKRVPEMWQDARQHKEKKKRRKRRKKAAMNGNIMERRTRRNRKQHHRQLSTFLLSNSNVIFAVTVHKISLDLKATSEASIQMENRVPTSTVEALLPPLPPPLLLLLRLPEHRRQHINAPPVDSRAPLLLGYGSIKTPNINPPQARPPLYQQRQPQTYHLHRL